MDIVDKERDDAGVSLGLAAGASPKGLEAGRSWSIIAPCGSGAEPEIRIVANSGLRIMANWDVYKPLGECSGSGQQMEFGDEYFGALLETEEGLQRRDFSVAYWEKEKPEVFCFWKTRLPHPEQKKKVFVDDEMLMAFFERLTDETEAERLNFRFVLALILMRKRRLKY